MEPTLPAVKAWSLNHWTTRDVLNCDFFLEMKENLSDAVWCFSFLIEFMGIMI